MIRAIRSIVSLKWALLIGGARASLQSRIQLAVSLLLVTVFGLASIVFFMGLGSAEDVSADSLVVVFAATTIGVGMFAATTGVEASLDPRQLAAEPLTSTQLALGMLASAVVGPPAVLAVLSGIGVFIGWRSGGPGDQILLGAVIVVWWITLLLTSRTIANVIGAWATGRLRRLAQAGAVSASLFGWFVANVLVGGRDRWNARGLSNIAHLAGLTPPGRLAMAVTTSGAESLIDLVYGISWLPLLLWASVVSTNRLVTVPLALVDGAAMRTGRRGLYGWFTSLLGPTAARGGHRRTLAIARRTMVTKFRTPRQAVNTMAALVVGGGLLVLGPLLDGGVGDPRSILLGGMLQFAVLFDGNNSFGVDGPAIWSEIQAGADADDLVRAKFLSSVVTVGPFALSIPLVLAVIADAWQWLPAAWLLAVGGLVSAAGVGVVMATLTPVAMPLSANPLAAGDTGQGCLAGVMLGAGVVGLAVLTAPFVVAVRLVGAHSTPVGTVVAAVFPVVATGVAVAALRLARRHLAGNEPALVDKVTPRL